jgi:uncharacterized protein (DUF1684 family)/lysophospholipase L1-like esterase
MTTVTVAQTDEIAGERPYAEGVEQWRSEREAGLTKVGGWLSVAGLHWLESGANTIGTGATNSFVLPSGSAPATVGSLTLKGDTVVLKLAPGVSATVNGDAVTGERELKTDAKGPADKLTVGSLTMAVIVRGKRTGVRLWDDNAAARKGFTRLNWYPVDESFRVVAKFVPYTPPKKVGVATILGDIEEGTSPGYVTFSLDGQECRLETRSEGEELFINFRDATSGDTTYAPGRFLYAAKPENGKVVLDFNRAYNPPCAFTPFATCPLPPRQNFLKVAIPAGEKKYHASEDDFVPAGQKIEYADDVAAFLKVDKANPPKKGGILFIGSSIFREWTHVGEQMAPLPVMNRAFGGARTWEVLHYADDIVLPYEPKIIVYYCGSNDINTGAKPEEILERYRQFSNKVTERLPETTVYYVSSFRSPQKKEHWDVVDATNRLIRDYSAKTKNRAFIDANPLVFDKKGEPREELYREDGLHYKESFYPELAALIKPILEKAWLAERKKDGK